jgi:hypothetical protein
MPGENDNYMPVKGILREEPDGTLAFYIDLPKEVMDEIKKKIYISYTIPNDKTIVIVMNSDSGIDIEW